MTVWRIDPEEALDDIQNRLDMTDPDHRRIVLTCSEMAVEWTDGGPRDGRYDVYRESWFAVVTGTPVIAEYLQNVHVVPPTARIVKYHWKPS